MSTVYTPTGGLFHNTISVPSPGDAATAGSVNNAALKYLGDNTAYLKARLDSVHRNLFFSPAFLDGDVTLSIGGNGYVAIATTLGANRTWRLDDVQTPDGVWLFAANRATEGFKITILDPDGSLLGVLANGASCWINRMDEVWAIDDGSLETRKLLASRLDASSEVTAPDVTAERLHATIIVDAAGLQVTDTAADFQAGLRVTGGNVNVQNDVLVHGDQGVNGALSVDGLVEFASTLIVGNYVRTGNGATFNGDEVKGTSLNALRVRTAVVTDVDAIIQRNTTTIVRQVTGSSFALTIFGFGQSSGDWVRVRSNTTGTCTLKDQAGNVIALLSGLVGFVCVEAVFADGAWEVSLSG